MDTMPSSARILIRGDNDLTQHLADLLSQHPETKSPGILASEEGNPRRGDLLVDLRENAGADSLHWCQENGVLYLTADSLGKSAVGISKGVGPTAILGHGDCPGLISHLVRIAIRDISHKILHGGVNDARRAELAKVLHAEDFARLAMLSGVHEIHLVAPRGHLRPEVARTLTDLLIVREQDRMVYRPKVRMVRSPELEASTSSSLGVLIRGQTFGGWWTGSRLDARVASTHVLGSTPATLQTAVGVLAAAIWMLENPRRGLLMPDQLPYEEILEVALPYLGLCESRSVNWQIQ